MTDQFSQKILHALKEKEIRPLPAWQVRMGTFLFWVAVVAAVLLAGTFLSLALLNIADIDGDAVRVLGAGRFARMLLFTAPHFWLLLSLITLALGFQALRHTGRGYRYHILFASVSIVFIASIFAVFAHKIHMSERLEESIENHFLVAPPFLPRPDDRWNHPEDGLIAGMVVSIEPASFTLATPQEKQWTVLYSNETSGMKNLEKNRPVRVLGEIRGQETFSASAIKPLPKPSKRFPQMKKDQSSIDDHNNEATED